MICELANVLKVIVLKIIISLLNKIDFRINLIKFKLNAYIKIISKFFLYINCLLTNQLNINAWLNNYYIGYFIQKKTVIQQIKKNSSKLAVITYIIVVFQIWGTCSSAFIAYMIIKTYFKKYNV